MHKIVITGREYYINLSKLLFMELNTSSGNFRLTLDFEGKKSITFKATELEELDDIVNGILKAMG